MVVQTIGLLEFESELCVAGPLAVHRPPARGSHLFDGSVGQPSILWR